MGQNPLFTKKKGQHGAMRKQTQINKSKILTNWDYGKQTKHKKD